MCLIRCVRVVCVCVRESASGVGLKGGYSPLVVFLGRTTVRAGVMTLWLSLLAENIQVRSQTSDLSFCPQMKERGAADPLQAMGWIGGSRGREIGGFDGGFGIKISWFQTCLGQPVLSYACGESCSDAERRGSKQAAAIELIDQSVVFIACIDGRFD